MTKSLCTSRIAEGKLNLCICRHSCSLARLNYSKYSTVTNRLFRSFLFDHYSSFSFALVDWLWFSNIHGNWAPQPLKKVEIASIATYKLVGAIALPICACNNFYITAKVTQAFFLDAGVLHNTETFFFLFFYTVACKFCHKQCLGD